MASDSFRVIRFSDTNQLLPDGTQVVYAENDQSIFLIFRDQKKDVFEYHFIRETGGIKVNGQEGGVSDKQKMVLLGDYFLANAKEDDLSYFESRDVSL